MMCIDLRKKTQIPKLRVILHFRVIIMVIWTLNLLECADSRDSSSKFIDQFEFKADSIETKFKI